METTMAWKVVHYENGDHTEGFSNEGDAWDLVKELEETFPDEKGCYYAQEYEMKVSPAWENRNPPHGQADGWEDLFNY